MLRREGGLRATRRERIGAIATAEQQGKRDGLGVGVRESFVRGV